MCGGGGGHRLLLEDPDFSKNRNNRQRRGHFVPKTSHEPSFFLSCCLTSTLRSHIGLLRTGEMAAGLGGGGG